MPNPLDQINLTPEYLKHLIPYIDLPITESEAAIRLAIQRAIVATMGEASVKDVAISLELVRDVLKIQVHIMVDTLQQQIDTLSQTITDLQGDLNSLQLLLGTTRTDLTGLQTSLGQVTSQVNTLDADLDATVAGLTVGQEIQGYSAILQAIAGLTLKANHLLGVNGAGAIEQFARGYARIEHRTAPASLGGNPTATAGTWATVPLNQITRQTAALGAIAMSNNAVILPAGTYQFRGRAYGCGVVRFQSRLRDITNGVTLSVGESHGGARDTFATDATFGALTLTQISVVEDEITLAAQTLIELQAVYRQYHASSATLGVNVFGAGASQIAAVQGTDEKYSSLVINRVG